MVVFVCFSLSLHAVSVFPPCVSALASVLSCLSLSSSVCLVSVSSVLDSLIWRFRRVLRYLELLRSDAVRAYCSAEDRYCGERCKMCPSCCCRVACVQSIRWLARLFDLDYGKVSNKFSWSLLLQRVAQRLEDDMELEFSAEFPWPLSHLSVRSVLRRVVAAVCAFRSWSISVARLTRLLTVTVVCRSELGSMG